MMTNYDDFYNSDILTDEQREAIELQVKLTGKLIQCRKEKGLTQKDLSTLTGIKQPAITRIEQGTGIPKIDTLVKLLKPLGYKLDIKITPISDKSSHR